MKNIKSVFKRELKAYFDSPVAYVFLTAFLVLVGFLTFGVAMFYERRQADLTPFFFWHPWVYLLLVPAATMGLWADERRNGTAEMLLTLPMTTWQALVGKFLAAWAFVGIALALTFPVALTAGYLGSPDWGVVLCGYLGSFMMAGAAAATGVFASTLSRSSVIGFVVSLALLFALMIVGFDPVTTAVANWGVPSAVVNGIASCSLLTHFESMRRGVVDFADIGYYAGMVAFMLAAAKTVTDGRRGASKGVAGLAAVATIAIAADVILANLPLRADLTAERFYTLSGGSRAVLSKLEQDVTVKYYVSSSAADMPMQLKTYAQRVLNLLKEYERASGGHVVLEAYDPKPDSDAEEWAQRYGVEPQTVNPFGSPIYFGVVAVCGDNEQTLGALSPRTETTLEYDITRLVTRVAWPERPVVGVMTSLPDLIGGQANPMAMQMGQRPPEGWAAFSELGKDYDVRTVATDADSIDEDVKTLVMVHAKDLSDKTLYAIDQFVLRGGKLIACVDPFSVKDMMASRQRQNPMMMQMGGQDGPSTLGKLFDAWGVTFDTGKITGDLAASTKLNNGQGGVDDNPAFLSLSQANMDKGDLLVSRLTQVMFPFAGAFVFEKKKDMDLAFAPVITTSKENSCSVDKMSVQFGGGAKDMVPDGHERVLAARLSGTFKTAFPKGPDGTNDVFKALKEGKGSVILFADTDFLADDFCVRMIKTPFGNIPQLINDNLTLFSNVIEQFAGREELIGVRSRGATDRPFAVVNELEAQATRKWQRKAAEFEAELQMTQQRLQALQKQKSGDERFILSKEQQEEILKLRKAQADTRKQLKNVRKELTADIDSLGLTLKCINIALVPALVVLFGLFRGFIRKRG
ncbi:MAG: Gldg family protein [Kiritimatiellae bacterium]|nr:Gldg family protein [Kiritimatiellia bacterium]